MEIKFKIWLEKDGHALFGEGRDQLLKAIDECHGLYGAAKKLKMSYRAAWGKIKLTEERIGKKIVETGEDKKLHLTKDAKKILDEFESWKRCRWFSPCAQVHFYRAERSPHEKRRKEMSIERIPPPSSGYAPPGICSQMHNYMK